VKVAEPLVEDVGEHVTLSTPMLGRNDHDDPPQIGGQVQGFAGQRDNPRQFYNAKADSKLLEDLDRAWHVPKRLEAWFDAEGSGNPELAGVRQEAGTPAIEPFRTMWQAKDRLKVDASFSRPSEKVRNERWIFLAGVLVSLAVSLLVWGLELQFGPERHPVARSGDGSRSRSPTV
jgi:hypothetical protein